MADHTPVLQSLDKDETYGQFLKEDFDVTNFTSSCIKTSSIPLSIQKLSNGINELNKEINTQVSANYESLLEQASSIRDLETILSTLNAGVATLEASISRIRKDITEPFNLVSTRTEQQARVHQACELLRRVIRFIYLARKLKLHLQPGNPSLPKAASCLHDLAQVRKETDLSGIAVVDAELPWIAKAEEDTLANASRMLTVGLETSSQAEVGSAVQVFHNLHVLKPRIEQTLQMLHEKTTKAIRSALTVHDLKGEGATQKTALWTRIQRLMDTIHTVCTQVWLLAKVLSKLSLLEAAGKSSDLPIVFWRLMTRLLQESMASAARQSTILEQTFVSDYPKLLRLMQDLLRRMATVSISSSPSLPTTPSSPSSVPPSSSSSSQLAQGGDVVMLGPDDQAALFRALSPFETGYLGRSLTRLTDNVMGVFGPPPHTPPTADQLLGLSRAIWGEVEVARACDRSLVITVSKGVAKALKMFCMKCEALTATDPDAFVIRETPAPSQILNLNLFNALIQLLSSISSLLSSHTLPQEAVQPITQALNSLETLCQQIVAPIFANINRVVDHDLMAMFREEWGDSRSQSSDDFNHQSDPFMRQFQNHVAHFHATILRKLTPCPTLSVYVQKLVSRMILLFVRYASLLRPIGESGKLRLTGDMAQLELSLAPLMPQGLHDVGAPYKYLRAFRPFMFQDQETAVQSLESKVLPPHIVMHHLISVHGPPALQLPHTHHHWPIVQYIEWLDNHNEKDAWNNTKAALDSYAAKVNQRGEKTFHPIYPLLYEHGPKLVAQWREENK